MNSTQYLARALVVEKFNAIFRTVGKMFRNFFPDINYEIQTLNSHKAKTSIQNLFGNDSSTWFAANAKCVWSWRKPVVTSAKFYVDFRACLKV